MNEEEKTVIYQDLSEMPLDRWINLAVSNNTKWLVKSGPIPDDLSDLHGELLAEYQTLIKDTKSSIEHKIKLNYTTLANRIDHVTIAVNALKIERDEDLIRILREQLGFERLTYEDLNRDLKLTENYLKMDVVKFERAKIQFEKMVKEAENHGSVNGKGQFYEQVVSLSKWLQFGIDPKQTSVLQYISYLNMLQLEISRTKNK